MLSWQNNFHSSVRPTEKNYRETKVPLGDISKYPESAWWEDCYSFIPNNKDVPRGFQKSLARKRTRFPGSHVWESLEDCNKIERLQLSRNDLIAMPIGRRLKHRPKHVFRILLHSYSQYHTCTRLHIHFLYIILHRQNGNTR